MKIANPKPLLKDLITVRDLVKSPSIHPVWLLGAADLLESIAREIRQEAQHAQAEATPMPATQS